MGAEDTGVRSSRANAPKPRANARKRTRRSRVIESDDDDDEDVPMTSTAEAPASPGGSPPAPAPALAPAPCSPVPEPSAAAFELDMEADISQLEPATFTTIRRGPPEPMLRLSWHHKVNLMGEKVLNPLIYVCEKCDCPVLSYGRMIPCKHVLCFDCAQPLKQCWRCGERAIRVERAGLGKLFMCLHDGKRYDNNGCRRTYLSQRDLQAHINHRHLRPPPSAAASAVQPPAAQPAPVVPTPTTEEPPRREPRALQREHSIQRSAADPRSASHRTPPSAGAALSSHASHASHRQASPPTYSASSPLKQQQIPVISSQRTGNLITIAIQGQEPAPSPVSLEPPSPVPPPVPAMQYAGYSQQYSYPGQPEPPPPPAAAASYYQSTPPPVPAPPGYGRPFSAPAGVPPRPQPYPTAVPPPPPQQTWPVSTPPPTLSRPPPDRRFYR